LATGTATIRLAVTNGSSGCPACAGGSPEPEQPAMAAIAAAIPHTRVVCSMVPPQGFGQMYRRTGLGARRARLFAPLVECRSSEVGQILSNCGAKSCDDGAFCSDRKAKHPDGEAERPDGGAKRSD